MNELIFEHDDELIKDFEIHLEHVFKKHKIRLPLTFSEDLRKSLAGFLSMNIKSNY